MAKPRRAERVGQGDEGRPGAAQRREIRQRLQEYVRGVKDVPCADCELRHPSYAMDFDHRPGTRKRFNISQAVRRCLPIEVIRAEIAKTDVVCCLCHRYRTHGLRRRPDGTVTTWLTVPRRARGAAPKTDRGGTPEWALYRTG